MFLKKIIAFQFLFVLSVLTWYCGNPGRSTTDQQGEIQIVDDSQNNPGNLVLPVLEPGEIHVTDDAFGADIELHGIPLDLKVIIKPEQLLVKGKYFVTNNERSDSVFMIFELPDLKCVAAFGVKGRGPDEFNFPRIVETYEDSVLFYIYEPMNDKIYKVTEDHLRPEYYLTLPKQSRAYGDKQIVFVDNNTAFYSASTDKGKMIYLFSKDSIPQEKKIRDLAISGMKGSWTTYIGDFGINKKSDRIAYAYKYFKRLKIIDILTMNERDIIFDSKDLTDGQSDIATLAPTNVTHFWGMSPKDDFFWMLYSGRTPVDVQRDNRNHNTYIFVEKYDWNGNPVRRYKLDDWGYFCVDENGETLYLASTASIHALLKYNLKDTVEIED